MIEKYYRLLDYGTNVMGKKYHLLTKNCDKAVEYYKNGGTIQVGYMQEYAGGRRYPWGKWETFSRRREGMK